MSEKDEARVERGPSMQRPEALGMAMLLERGGQTNAAAIMREQHAEIERLRAELENEHIRLAACGVVAMSNTQESAVKARNMSPIYWSASCGDVAEAVDREMTLRAENERLRAERNADRRREYGYSQETVDALTKERDALRVDAERYRYLRECARVTSEHWGGRWSLVIDGPAPRGNAVPASIDAAIDAAREAK